MLTISAIPGDIAASDADAIVVSLFDGTTSLSGGTEIVDKALHGAISELIAEKKLRVSMVRSP